MLNPSKEKYSHNNCNDTKYSLSGPAHPPKEKYPLSRPPHPPKEKYSLQIVLKLVIKCIGDTACDSYIAETLVPLRSTFKPKKQTRFESDPVTSVRHIPARCNKETFPPKRTINPLDPDLLIPIELSQVTTEILRSRDPGDQEIKRLRVLRDLEAGEANDTSKAHSPPSQPCGQFQAERSENSDCESIGHSRTNTSSQGEIFAFTTVTPSQSEIFSQTAHTIHNNSYNNCFRTITSSQSECSLKLQIAAQPKLGLRQTFTRSFTHPSKVIVRQPAAPAAQRLPGSPHPPKVKCPWRYQQSMMQAVRQVQEKLQDPPPQSLAI